MFMYINQFRSFCLVWEDAKGVVLYVCMWCIIHHECVVIIASILWPCSGLERDMVHIKPRPDAVLPAHGSRLVPLFLSVGLQSILPPLPSKLPRWAHLVLQTLLRQNGEQKTEGTVIVNIIVAEKICASVWSHTIYVYLYL